MPKSPVKTDTIIFSQVAKSFATNMGKAVSAVFDRLRTRLMGNPIGAGKKIVFSPKYTLEGLYRAAAGIDYDKILLQHLKQVTESYLDAEEARAKAGIAHIVQSWLSTNPDTNAETVLGGELAAIMGKAISNVHRIVGTELNNAKNFGTLDYITRISSAIGVEDPVVYWVCVFQRMSNGEQGPCGECRKIHLMPDGITPRLWKLSEVGSGYHRKGDESPKLGGLHPNCFTGEMKLHTDKGMISFAELHRNQEKVQVCVDKRAKINKKTGVLWLDRHVKGVVQKPASLVYDTGVQECLLIRLDNGVSIEVSRGHEMWIDDDNMGLKKPAKDLLVGEKIPLVSGECGWGDDHFPEMAELMGNMLGDGTLSQTWAQWNFFGADIPYGQELLKKIWHQSDLRAKRAKRKKAIPKIYPPGKKYKVPRMQIASQTVALAMISEFGLSKKPRRVPERIWRADKETVSAFLRGLYAADGCPDMGKESLGVTIAQNDRKFLEEIQLLLSNFGLRAGLYQAGEGGDASLTYADGSVHKTKRKPSWRLTLGSFAQTKRFYEEIGLGVPSKQERLEKALASFGTRTQLGAWRTHRIESIESIGEKQTYCITERETNTVSVNGIVTGNCKCHMETLPPGYGFEGGRISYIGADHDEFAKQRG